MTDTAAETERLVALMVHHGIAAFEYRDGERTIRIVNGAVEDADALPAERAQALPSLPVLPVRSPAVGRFLRAGADPLPAAVTKGQILGFVTSGMLRLPVQAPEDGLLLSVCHADETPVGYGTTLFEYRQNL